MLAAPGKNHVVADRDGIRGKPAGVLVPDLDPLRRRSCRRIAARAAGVKASGKYITSPRAKTQSAVPKW